MKKKRHAVLSNYKSNVNEAWQLWLERDVVKRICFSFSICSLVFKLHKFKVALFWKTPTQFTGLPVGEKWTKVYDTWLVEFV